MGAWERIQNLLRTEEPATVNRLAELCGGDLKIGEIETLLFQMARGGAAHRKEETRNNRSTEFWYYGKEEQSSMSSNAEINAILRETKIKTPPKRLPPGWKFDRALLPNYVAFNYAKNLRTRGFSSKLLAICNAHDLEAERNGAPILRDDAEPELGAGTPFPTVFPQAELERMREYHAGDAIAEEKPVKICYVLEQPHVITGSVSSGKEGTIEIEAWPILPIENIGEENAKTYADALAEYEAAFRSTNYGDVVIDYQNVRVNCGSKSKPRWWVMVGPEMKFTREDDQVSAADDLKSEPMAEDRIPWPKIYPVEELQEMAQYYAIEKLNHRKPIQLYYLNDDPFVIAAVIGTGDGIDEIRAYPALPVSIAGEPQRLQGLIGTKFKVIGKKEPWVILGPEAIFTPAPQACRGCGCTQNDCRQCIEKTGSPCWWVEPGLCSACSASAAVETESAAPTQTKAGGKNAKPAKRGQGENGSQTSNGSPGNGGLDLREIPVDQITPWLGGQIRTYFDQVKLEELAASISEKGVLQPILVRPLEEMNESGKRFELIAGERRWRAACIAQLEIIPAIVRELDDRAALEVQVIENLQRADLSEIEEAFGYQRLIKEYDYAPDQIAEKVGKSKTYIYGRLKLCNLPAPAVQALNRGELPASIGELIGRLPSDQLREQFWQDNFEDIGDELFEMPSFRDIKGVIERSYMRELKSAPFSQTDKKLLPEAGSCKDCPKRTGNNRVEYPEGRADVCTDPGCFKRKVEAHNERQVVKLEKSGAQVLRGEEAAEFFIGSSRNFRSEVYEKYVNLDDECEAYTDSQVSTDYDQDLSEIEEKTYRELVGGEVQQIVVVDPAGNPHYLAPAEEAQRVLLAKYGIDETPDSSGSGSSESYKESQRKARLAKEIRQKAAADICGRIVQSHTDNPFFLDSYNGNRPIDSFLQVIASHLINEGDADIARFIGKRREIKYDSNDVRGSVVKHIPITDKDKLGLIIEYLIAKELHWWIQSGEQAWGAKRGFPICAYFGFDPKKIEKTLTKEAAAAEKAKKAAKKPKAKKPAAVTEATQ